MRLPLPCLIGPAGRLPCACWSVAWILACSAFRADRLPFSCFGSGRTEPRARGFGARARGETLLGSRDLVATPLDDLGQPLLAALQLVQALGRGRRVGLGVAHD